MPWRGRELFIPDKAIGRLVEAPADIIQTLANYDGIPADIQSCTVSGYEFLTDSAVAIENRLVDFNLNTSALTNDTWIRDDLLSAWPLGPGSLLSVNAHFDHWRAEPASGVGGLFYSSDLPDSPNLIAYSMGCHSGLNVPDSTPVSDELAKSDFTQVLAQKGAAAWVANTGFGFGVDDAIAATEQLMLYYTQEIGLEAEVAVGQALTNAKQRFAGMATSSGFSIYDEKAMIEATLYGLPMTTVNVAAPQPIGGSAVEISNSEVISSGDVDKIQSTINLLPSEPTEHLTEYGTYYSIGDEVQAWPGRPIQPRAAFVLPEVSGKNPHGQLLISAAYQDYESFDPVVVIPLTEETQPEPSFNAPGWYPNKLWAVNRFGDQHRSTLVLGQFEPNEAVERLYNELVLETYYTADNDDFSPPIIWGIASDIAGETGFAATVEGAARVLVTYNIPDGTGGGILKSADLHQEVNDPSLWSLVPAPDEVLTATDYFIQAVDAAGNVSIASKEGFHDIGGNDPDSLQSIGTTRTVNVTLEFDAGDGLGFQPVLDGLLADHVSLEPGSVGWIQEDTCSTSGTVGGECSVTITSDQPGDSVLVIEFNTAYTRAKFNFTTRWWAGTADIYKYFESTPYTTGTPSASFTLLELDSQGNVIGEISTLSCSDGSNGCYFQWTNLPEGSYRLQESAVNAPHAAMKPIDFLVDLAHPDFHAPTVENKLLPGELVINKQFSGGNPWTGPQVNFDIYDCTGLADCSTAEILAAVAVIESGANQTTLSLHEGMYLVREIAPEGFSPIDGGGEQQVLVLAGDQTALTFTNNAQGCSPGFWQGGSGSFLWDANDDPEWSASGGKDSNPFNHAALFNEVFTPYGPASGYNMYDLVSTGGGAEDWQKAARNVVAAYLNTSWGLAFPYTEAQIAELWTKAVNNTDEVTFIEIHNLLGAANSTPNTCPISKP
jgi:hypothetical protein